MNNEGAPRPKSPERKRDIREGEEAKKLPETLDNKGTLFAYGYLLDKPKLRELLNTRTSNFPIYETTSIEEASKLTMIPQSIVMLRGVRMEGVDVGVITEAQLREWYSELGGNVQALVDEGVLTQESTHAGLYARASVTGKPSRFLNGGLVCGFTPSELERIDKFEMVPVYERVKVPRLIIDDGKYVPEHIAFYAGNYKFKRAPGEYKRLWEKLHRGQGKWPEDIRSDNKKSVDGE